MTALENLGTTNIHGRAGLLNITQVAEAACITRRQVLAAVRSGYAEPVAAPRDVAVNVAAADASGWHFDPREARVLRVWAALVSASLDPAVAALLARRAVAGTDANGSTAVGMDLVPGVALSITPGVVRPRQRPARLRRPCLVPETPGADVSAARRARLAELRSAVSTAEPVPGGLDTADDDDAAQLDALGQAQ